MLLEYSIYLARAVVSAMVAVFMLLIRTDTFLLSKYKYTRTGVAAAAMLDLCMDVWGCSMMLNGIYYFKFHWVWAIVYYVEWTILGICVLKLVESRHRFYWFPPLLIWYVFSDSKAYRNRVDDNFAGTQNENLHELSYFSPILYATYLILTTIDLFITGHPTLDAGLVLLSTAAIVWITISIFNLQPKPSSQMLFEQEDKEKLSTDETDNIESRVLAWESRQDKPYCKENITLLDVAEEMNVNPRVLSSYINSVRMVNFNNWINGLRVRQIKQIIKEKPSVQIFDLMVESGFQSRASLSRAVKAATGMTVSQLKGISEKGGNPGA